MGKVTFVVDFEDGKEPPVNFGTEILGGRLTAISWFDYHDDFFTEEQVDIVRSVFDDTAFNDAEEEKRNAIISKMEMMTL